MLAHKQFYLRLCRYTYKRTNRWIRRRDISLNRTFKIKKWRRQSLEVGEQEMLQGWVATSWCELNNVVPVFQPSASILGGWGVATPRFWAGGHGVTGGRRGSWTELGKHYSLFCTEITLQSVFFVFFIRKREKLAQNIGAKGENVNI